MTGARFIKQCTIYVMCSAQCSMYTVNYVSYNIYCTIYSHRIECISSSCRLYKSNITTGYDDTILNNDENINTNKHYFMF